VALTLITGVPGTGKTALAVAMLRDVRQADPRRPIYVDGIKDLLIAHEPMPPRADWTTFEDDPSSSTGKKLVYAFPVGSLIVLDEAQRIFRPRGTGSKVPPEVEAMETHRHSGHEVWLLTQHPGLIDANLRKLVDRHLHIRNNFMGRKLFEWAECGDPETKASRDVAAKRSYKPDKRVFRLYRSAEQHTKLKRRVPVFAYVALLAVALSVVLGYNVYRSFQARNAPVDVKGSQPGTAPAKAPGSPGAAPAGLTQVNLAAQWVDASRERVDGLPHTAPLYDSLTAPKQAPFPSACVASRERCQCFTAQATPIAMAQRLCRTIVKEGLYQAYADVPSPGGTRNDSGDERRAAGAAGGERIASVNPGEDQPQFLSSTQAATVQRHPSAKQSGVSQNANGGGVSTPAPTAPGTTTPGKLTYK
jgi:zona occludens toxin